MSFEKSKQPLNLTKYGETPRLASRGDKVWSRIGQSLQDGRGSKDLSGKARSKINLNLYTLLKLLKSEVNFPTKFCGKEQLAKGTKIARL